jgi:hypothetical protein
MILHMFGCCVSFTTEEKTLLNLGVTCYKNVSVICSFILLYKMNLYFYIKEKLCL